MAEAVGDVEVVGEASSGAEALAMSRTLEPDVVLMDLDMPRMDGVEATRLINEERPDAAVLVLTVHDDENAMIDAIKAGAAGFVPKSSGVEDIRRAIDALKQGGTYLPSSTAIKLLAVMRHEREHVPHPISKATLTPREVEVLSLLADGLSARAIARRLAISERTVNSHATSIYRKIGVTNRVGAVREAVRAGLIDLRDG
jgi:DNA-binding NarL/FixJ family response regulator